MIVDFSELIVGKITGDPRSFASLRLYVGNRFFEGSLKVSVGSHARRTEHHRSSLGRQPGRDRASDASARAGDEGDLAVALTHVWFSCRSTGGWQPPKRDQATMNPFDSRTRAGSN